MKVKVGQVLTSVESKSLAKLLENDVTAITRHKLKKNVEIIEKEFKLIMEMKRSLFEKYGVVKEDGSINIEDKEKETLFLNEFNEYLDNEIEVDIETISINDLSDTKISYNDEVRLSYLLESE